jgi:hypothetical protein
MLRSDDGAQGVPAALQTGLLKPCLHCEGYLRLRVGVARGLGVTRLMHRAGTAGVAVFLRGAIWSAK